MLYEIDKKYYIRVGRRFIEVDVDVKNDEIDVIPHKPTKEIENNGNIKYKTQKVNEDFKKQILMNKDRKNIGGSSKYRR